MSTLDLLQSHTGAWKARGANPALRARGPLLQRVLHLRDVAAQGGLTTKTLLLDGECGRRQLCGWICDRSDCVANVRKFTVQQGKEVRGRQAFF